jgi:hypothetical protein
LLLRRAPQSPRAAIAHLAGLQAQAPLAPYVGLWTRLAGFAHNDLKNLLSERTVVRAHLMRNTVHLVTAADFLSFRPLFQPLMERALSGNSAAPAAAAAPASRRRACLPPPRPAPTMCALVRFRNIQFREVSPRFVPAHI